jgi:capsular polysaccharide transport system ATP-binding protein
MIELKNVCKSYPVNSGVKHILKNVSLCIPGGTNLAILGPNGAGKSTLLRLIGGAEAPNHGSIHSDLSVSWPLGIGSGFQSSLSGLQNVLFVCRINGLSRLQTRQVIDEVVEFTELGKYFELPVRTYSSGMRARLSFGLSMAFLFDIYLVDELTSVGDAIFRAKAKEAFENMRNRASLIFVSHNLQTLRESCNSALFLHDGSAEFFPDIEDGILAYQEFIRSDRLNHEQEIRALKKAKRLEMRRQKIEKLNRAASTESETAP